MSRGCALRRTSRRAGGAARVLRRRQRPRPRAPARRPKDAVIPRRRMPERRRRVGAPPRATPPRRQRQGRPAPTGASGGRRCSGGRSCGSSARRRATSLVTRIHVWTSAHVVTWFNALLTELNVRRGLHLGDPDLARPTIEDESRELPEARCNATQRGGTDTHGLDLLRSRGSPHGDVTRGRGRSARPDAGSTRVTSVDQRRLMVTSNFSRSPGLRLCSSERCLGRLALRC